MTPTNHFSPSDTNLRNSPPIHSDDRIPVVKGSHVYLIDGSGYIFRAFHALPPLTRPSDGLPVGAVHGFCAMLWKLLQETKLSEAPTHMAVIFDAGRKTFRNKIYDKYKANRKPPPEELIPQFPLIREAVLAFNVSAVEQEGYEADDLIATYAKYAADHGADVTIVSSDKDLMQLVRPGVVMLDAVKGKRIGREEVIEKFGVPPEKVVDVQSLAGDSTDNVPGVPGIGLKTAAELINEYGNLDTLLENAGNIKQSKRREKLLEFTSEARISRDLVKLKEDVPEALPLEKCGVREPHPSELLAFLRSMEFNTLTRRIAEKLDIALPLPSEITKVSKTGRDKIHSLDLKEGMHNGAGTLEAGVEAARHSLIGIKFDRSAYETVKTLDHLDAWIDLIKERGVFAFDTETTSLNALEASLVGFSLALNPGEACYVPVHHGKKGEDLFGSAKDGSQYLSLHDALERMKPILEDPTVLKIGHNIKYDTLILLQNGIHISPFDDTMLMSYVLDAGRGGHGLDELAERHFGHVCIGFDEVLAHAPGQKKSDKTFADVPIDKATQYAAEDADVTLRLWRLLKPRLAAEKVLTVYETLERPLVPVIVCMEKDGIKVEPDILSRLSNAFARRASEHEESIYKIAGHHFNLASPKQLGEFLFDTLKLPGGRKTKTGQWETRAGVLDDLANNEELPEDERKLVNIMMEWRQLSKLRSTYTDALPNFINPNTKRIHTSYSLAATTTGRLASSDPNLQNIPIRTKEGREIRTAFVAEKGKKLISADYSQIELRVLAHIADIPQLKKAFVDGLDIHSITASEMFSVPLKNMTSEIRRRAKAINFGIIYGISPFGLANQLGIGREEAGNYIKTYFERFPKIKEYMEQTKASVHAKGYVETVFGRKIHYPEINTKNPSMRGFLERAAINAPIQGTAADVLRRAMIRLPSALQTAGLYDCRMLLQVHDELIFEVPENKVEILMLLCCKVMERAAEPAVHLTVPLHVDAKAAYNWEAAH